LPSNLDFLSCKLSCHVSRRQNDLLLLAPEVLASRIAALKVVVPHADVFALINHGPWLLLLRVCPLLCSTFSLTLRPRNRACCMTPCPKSCVQNNKIIISLLPVFKCQSGHASDLNLLTPHAAFMPGLPVISLL